MRQEWSDKELIHIIVLNPDGLTINLQLYFSKINLKFEIDQWILREVTVLSFQL